MRPISFARVLVALTLGVLVGACGPTGAQPVTQPPATNTPAPSATVAASATATATATASPTPTLTDTPRPTATATRRPTRTAAPTNTPTPVPTATRTPLPLPTFTPSPPPAAPVFAETIMHPFTPEHFRNELNELVRFQSKFLAYFKTIVETGVPGRCDLFYGYRNETIVSQAGYNDVPAAWYDLYFQYRVLLVEAVNNVQPITSVCDAGGGTIPLETDLAIIAGLESIVARAQALEAAGISHP